MELIQGKHENILAVGQTERKNGALLTKDKLLQQYLDVFNGTGKIDGKYHLDIEDGAVPVVLPPRRVPVALNPLLKDELRKLQDLEIIAPTTETTPWVLVW